MKPPICEVCDEWFDPEDGGLVEFLTGAVLDPDRPVPAELDDDAPEPPGHPSNKGWFCATHLEVARRASASMTLAEALRDLVGSVDPPPPPSGARRPPFEPSPDPDFGSVDASVLSLPGGAATEPAAAALSIPGLDPLAPGPDLVGVDLRGGQIRRGIGVGRSSIDWALPGVPLALARQRFLALVPELFEAFGLGPVPELIESTRRSWTPMDGSKPPNCPFTDLVRHEASAPNGTTIVSVSTDQVHWSDDDIDNVSAHLFVNVADVRVSAFASGRGTQDACTSLTLFRPTSATVVAALTAAFGLSASGSVEAG